jgi:predicted transposase YbfD/YdcC
VPVSHVLPCPTSIDGREGLADVAELYALFERLSDPRRPRGVRHSLASVLTVMVFAVLAGAANYREAGDRVADLPEVLLTAARTRRHRGAGVLVPPSGSTIRRIVEDLDADAADGLVGAWLAGRAGDGGLGVAIDGKVVRGSGGGYGDVRLFSAMRHDTAVVIAQLTVPAGTNETTQVAALLDPVDIAGLVVTADAAHTQDATAAYLVGRDADYVLTVKGNRPRLLAQIRTALGAIGLDDLDGVTDADHADLDAGHGRRVVRAIWCASAEGIDFPGAAQVFRIRREVSDTAGRRISKKIVHGISSLSTGSAAAPVLAGHVRSRWGIEKKIHWVQDVVFAEDAQHAYLGATAQAMGVFRNLAIGLIRLSGTGQITRTVERIAPTAAESCRCLPHPDRDHATVSSWAVGRPDRARLRDRLTRRRSRSRPVTATSIRSPTPTACSGLSRGPSASSSRWTSPSTPSAMRTNAPNGTSLVTMPRRIWPSRALAAN